MGDKTNPTPQPTLGQSLTGSALIAIISLVFVACWIAYAYYKGTDAATADGEGILLLHPVVAVILIVLLLRIRPLIDVKSVVDLHILMIAIWVFKNLLSVLMPFLLGFGIAYYMRFLLDAIQDIPLPKGKRLQLPRPLARGLLTVFILGIFTLLFFYTVPQIGRQAQDMTKGLVRFYHQSILPFAMGNELNAVENQPIVVGNTPLIDAATIEAQLNQGNFPLELHRIFQDHGIPLSSEIQVSGEIKLNRWLIADAANRSMYAIQKTKDRLSIIPDTLYVGTEHGLYRFDGNGLGLTDITDGFLIGQSIQSISTVPFAEYQIIVGTPAGLYGYIRPSTPDKMLHGWQLVEEDLFAGKSVLSIATSDASFSRTHVGTDQGIFTSKDDGSTWEFAGLSGQAIRSIIFDPNDNARTYAATDKGVYYADNLETPQWLRLDSRSIEVPSTILTLAISSGGRLYAGTSNGIYGWDARKNRWYKDINQSFRLHPPISLLFADARGGLFAGNRETIHYRAFGETEWELIVNANKGIFNTLENLPMVSDTGLISGMVAELKRYLKTKLPTLAQAASQYLGKFVFGLPTFALGFGGFLATLFLTLMVFVYAGQSLVNYIRSFIKLFPEHNRPIARRYMAEIDRNLQSFLKGQVTVVCVISIISVVVYSIVGVPFALVVGILAGICNAIPTFGPYIGGAFALLSMLMGLAAGNFELVEFLVRIAVVLGAIAGIQALDNSLISPKVMGSAVDVDPLLIMFGVIVGAVVLGFWGVILAIPIIVVIKSVRTVSNEFRSPTPE
ncbi:MAG: AI-2E family transporter [Candidatus Poribacteria bacterium]|nr:AI-2E family transporter [Candidatus Poribacteria bacterium]MDE0503685.1 AI-2E family transporter [Candidatus Poribacteria bacterium]